MIRFGEDGAKDWSQTYGNYPGGVNQFNGIEEGNLALV